LTAINIFLFHELGQRGPNTGPRKEFSRPASFLSIDCCMYVTLLQWAILIRTSIASLITAYNTNGVRLDCSELLGIDRFLKTRSTFGNTYVCESTFPTMKQV